MNTRPDWDISAAPRRGLGRSEATGRPWSAPERYCLQTALPWQDNVTSESLRSEFSQHRRQQQRQAVNPTPSRSQLSPAPTGSQMESGGEPAGRHHDLPPPPPAQINYTASPMPANLLLPPPIYCRARPARRTHTIHARKSGQWNVDIQRAITDKLTLDVAYVGTHGYQEQSMQGSQPAADWHRLGPAPVPEIMPLFACTPRHITAHPTRRLKSRLGHTPASSRTLAR